MDRQAFPDLFTPFQLLLRKQIFFRAPVTAGHF